MRLDKEQFVELTKEETQQCLALAENLLRMFNGFQVHVVEVACINAIGSVHITHAGPENRKEIAEQMMFFAVMVAQAIEQILTNPNALVSRKDLEDIDLIHKPS